uniref:Uncharacterized protein n=1 Tax=viral metagenome TaxID=1070528 RepID=A0A6M3XZU9_9ZZZZ
MIVSKNLRLKMNNIILICTIFIAISLYLFLRVFNLKKSVKEFLTGAKSVSKLRKEVGV